MHEWSRFRDRRPTDFELRLWSQNWPDANVGLLLGTPAGPDLSLVLIAVDVDATDPDEFDAIVRALPPTTMAKRGLKGQTNFYAASPDIRSRGYKVGVKPHMRTLVDLLTGNQTRQTVVPPSVHPDGPTYTWIRGPVAPANLPVFDEDALSELEETLESLGWGADAQLELTAAAKDRDPDQPKTIWRDLNDHALADLSAWVPDLDLYKCKAIASATHGTRYEAVATWRESNTGRPTEKRARHLIIRADGIKDMGADQTYTALDLVQAARGCGLDEAFRWLNEKLERTAQHVLDPRPSTLAIDQVATPRAVQRSRFNLTRYAEIPDEIHKTWLVDDMLGAGELSVFYGVPGCGKSALAGDLACHVAAGFDWFGREVQAGPAVYLAAERPSLVKRRMAAWRKKRGVLDLPLLVVDGSIDLCQAPADVDEVSRIVTDFAAEAGSPARLIIVDTVAQVLAGADENSGKDMGALVSNLARLQSETGAHVAVVHHVPLLDPHRMRGHGALPGAADCTFRIEKAGDVRTISIVKANDAPDDLSLAFAFESVTVGVNAKGRETTAPVVVEADAPHEVAAPRRPRLPAQAQLVMSAFGRLFDDGRDCSAPNAPGVAPGQRAVAVADLRAKAFELGLCAGEQPTDDADERARKQFRDRRNKAFQRGLERLQSEKILRVERDFVWEPGRAGMFAPRHAEADA